MTRSFARLADWFARDFEAFEGPVRRKRASLINNHPINSFGILNLLAIG